MKMFKRLSLMFVSALVGIGVFSGISSYQVARAEVSNGKIEFGTNKVKIDSANVTGEDSLNNTWTITTTGTSSFTANAAYYQVGSSKNSASTITMTMSLSSAETITSFSAKFGGFSGTAGNITFKLDGESVKTGSLKADSDVTVSYTGETEAQDLEIDITGIAKGVKIYNIEYSYGVGEVTPTVTFEKTSGKIGVNKETTIQATTTNVDDLTWTSSNPGVATVTKSSSDFKTATIRGLAAGTSTIKAAYSSTVYAEYTLEVVAGPSHAGTFEDPFTVADSIHVIDNSLTESGQRYYVKGLFKNYYNNDNTKNSYFIVDSLETSNVELELYLDKSSFVPQFTVGEELIASATAANIIKYNSTYEFKEPILYNPITDLQITVNKTFTQIGETLTKSDLTVIAKHKHGEIEVSDYKINNSDSVSLNSANNTVTISYTNSKMTNVTFFGNNTFSKDISINGLAVRECTSLELKGALTKTEYTTEDENWNLDGITVDLIYSIGDNLNISISDKRLEVSVSPEKPALRVNSITVTATYEGHTDSKSYNVAVLKGQAYKLIASYGVISTKNTGSEYSDKNDLTLVSGTNIINTANSTGKVYVGIAKGSGGFSEERKDVLRFGSGSSAGSIAFALNTSVTKVVISAKAWSATEGRVSVSGSSQEYLTAGFDAFENLAYTFTAAKNAFTVSCLSGNRFFIESISFYANVSYEEELATQIAEAATSKTRIKMSYDYQELTEDILFSNIHVSLGAVVEKSLIDSINEVDDIVEIGVEVLKNNYVSYSSTTKTYSKAITSYTSDMNTLRTDDKANVNATGSYYSWWATIKFLSDNTHSVYSDWFLENVDLLTDITFTAKAYVKTSTDVKIYMATTEEYSVSSLAEKYYSLGYRVPGLQELADL